jgi:Zn-dependent peptidase ImmA (M78 family)
MKLLRDPLGRPIPRLYFKAEDLDQRCEAIAADFMDRHCGGYSLPIPTDDIIKMIEADADDLDLYADLPEGIDGFTDFFVDRKPRVLIAKYLSDLRYEKRLRMTLCHEFGHVWFHAPLWRYAVEPDRRPVDPCWTCHRDTIESAPENDWMEWQAAYIGGAILMPADSVRLWAREIALERDRPPVNQESLLARDMIHGLMRLCEASEQAAQVRLRQLGLITWA